MGTTDLPLAAEPDRRVAPVPGSHRHGGWALAGAPGRLAS
jgi:hypothetical protein